MLDVDKLVVLRSVAAHGSIAAAARELKYTRSAVSQQMSALERAAGCSLLVRGGRTVSLTPIGRRLLEHTERLLIELRAAEATVHRHSGEVGGALRVGVAFHEGPALMSSALTGVRREHPGLELTLVATTDEKAGEEVRLGRLDMAMVSQFGASPAPAPLGLRQWVLSQDPLRLCVAEDHPLADRSSCTMVDLRDEPWVLDPSGPLGRVTLALCATAGFVPVVAASVGDVATALGLVTVGWGITIAPELTPVVRNATLTSHRADRRGLAPFQRACRPRRRGGLARGRRRRAGRARRQCAAAVLSTVGRADARVVSVRPRRRSRR